MLCILGWFEFRKILLSYASKSAFYLNEEMGIH